MSDIDRLILKLPLGLKNFVNKSLELIDYNQFLNAFKDKYQILDGYVFHWALICWFLQLEIHFDRTLAPVEFQEIKYVKQLPETEIKNCLLYLNYILGTTVHTGGHDYVKMYNMYKKNL